ncbi:ExbD/TolR family protein [Tritonibacter scottomollicae]|uniref:Outer membrane transport energization protein ExbD n=1 Tax=Tritonibacter scottomollicae TaxID=483013 RepID=A0A2T1AGC6_TRISK|nr:biopolymer transporter ExbD [Tritonibacter scottomollicae]PRZ47652.1 outer membrane transport energization protein ExbD [Tritonibacter scottomollicae]
MALRLSKRHARRLSMTSLIDVIFLLLLFFMLSSTFSRFGTVDLMAAEAGQGTSGETRSLFLRLTPDQISLNGEVVAVDAIEARLVSLRSDRDAEETQVLVSLAGTVTSQRLVDVLAVLRQQPKLAVTVLG